MRDPKNRELYIPPHTTDSVPTPRTKEQFKFPTHSHVIKKPPHFERALKRLKDTGKIDIEDFNNGAELGAFIDLHNNNLKEKKNSWYENERIEIAKLLAKIMTSKTFLLNKPKNDTI